jgi:hypothetical protein
VASVCILRFVSNGQSGFKVLKHPVAQAGSSLLIDWHSFSIAYQWSAA